MGIYVEDKEDLRLIIKGLQHQGKQVVMTNGVFDFLHVGHIRSLKDAKSRGDFLIVGVNSDASTRKLKGKGLPINKLEERVEVLNELQCVDYIVVINEATADDTLALLRPNIHAKGADYTPETVPERETVLGYGGKIAIVGDPKDHSTSRIIKKLMNLHSAKGTPIKKATKGAKKEELPKKKIAKKKAAKKIKPEKKKTKAKTKKKAVTKAPAAPKKKTKIVKKKKAGKTRANRA